MLIRNTRCCCKSLSSLLSQVVVVVLLLLLQFLFQFEHHWVVVPTTSNLRSLLLPSSHPLQLPPPSLLPGSSSSSFRRFVIVDFFVSATTTTTTTNNKPYSYFVVSSLKSSTTTITTTTIKTQKRKFVFKVSSTIRIVPTTPRILSMIQHSIQEQQQLASSSPIYQVPVVTMVVPQQNGGIGVCDHDLTDSLENDDVVSTNHDEKRNNNNKKQLQRSEQQHQQQSHSDEDNDEHDDDDHHQNHQIKVNSVVVSSPIAPTITITKTKQQEYTDENCLRSPLSNTITGSTNDDSIMNHDKDTDPYIYCQPTKTTANTISTITTITENTAAFVRRRPLMCQKQIDSLLWNEARYERPQQSVTVVDDQSPLPTTSSSKIQQQNQQQNQPPVVVPNHRSKYLSWDDYFMSIAVLSSYRSKDPYQPSGCCIVDPYNRIIGTGYNGLPIGIHDDLVPWNTPQQQQHDHHPIPFLHTSAAYVVPAETNAILNKCSTDCYLARLYTMYYPSNECAKIIIQAGIREVIYLKMKSPQQQQQRNEVTRTETEFPITTNNTTASYNCNDDTASIRASRILFGLAGVQVRCYQPTVDRVVLNFTKVLEHKIVPTTTVSSCDHNTNHDDDDSPLTTTNENHESQIQNEVMYNEEHRQLLIREANYDILNPPVGTVKKRCAGSSTSTIPSPTTTTISNDSDENDSIPLLSWDDYFMAMAFLTAQRSKDPNTQVGACLVDPKTKKIVGLGYNGFPIGCSDHDLPWTRTPLSTTIIKNSTAVPAANPTSSGNNSSSSITNMNPIDDYQMLHTKYMYVVHAEQNAIMNKGSANVMGATLYVALFPCHECAKLLIQAGIQEIVYLKDPYRLTPSCRASRILLTLAGVTFRYYQPTIPCITLKF